MANFILVLIEHARLPQFQEMTEAYENILDELRGTLRADVVSCEEVDEAMNQGSSKSGLDFDWKAGQDQLSEG